MVQGSSGSLQYPLHLLAWVYIGRLTEMFESEDVETIIRTEEQEGHVAHSGCANNSEPQVACTGINGALHENYASADEEKSI